MVRSESSRDSESSVDELLDVLDIPWIWLKLVGGSPKEVNSLALSVRSMESDSSVSIGSLLSRVGEGVCPTLLYGLPVVIVPDLVMLPDAVLETDVGLLAVPVFVVLTRSMIMSLSLM